MAAAFLVASAVRMLSVSGHPVFKMPSFLLGRSLLDHGGGRSDARTSAVSGRSLSSAGEVVRTKLVAATKWSLPLQ